MTINPTLTLGGQLTINRLGFGAMRITPGDHWPSEAERRNGIAVARRAVELGVTFVDTADSYNLGANEELLADALHPYPECLVIATKAGQSRPGLRWAPLGRPEYLKQQAELSLRRLRQDRIDLFQLHRVDPQVAFEDQIGALRELRDAGKIRLVGLSEVTVAQLEQAREIVEIASVQNIYNVDDRRHEDVVDYCEKHEIAFVSWYPVATAGRSQGVLQEIAGETGGSPVQVALAWQLHRSPALVPIPGTGSAHHLEENVAAGELALTEEQVRRLTSSKPGHRSQ
ncbi:aldo/keto reductase [Flindersiella endophytica]